MPKPRLPPTPVGSTDLKALEVKGAQASDMESMFALPPPAIAREHSSKSSPARGKPGSTHTQNTPPVSPQDRHSASSPRHKRTSSGAVKSSASVEPASRGADANAYALPPPPSRARKIIQMKPKSQSVNTSSPASDASYNPPGSSNAAPAATSIASSTKALTVSNTSSTATPTSNSKRKQPSATSAAGRKIARKTAHSIIERRRRSKMNEEFGVLKDMIPACEGVEMHKLAILQAGIEYVRYLEGCVTQLKAENGKLGGNTKTLTSSRVQIDPRQDVDEDEDFEEEEEQDGEQDEEDDEAVDDVPETAAPPVKMRSHNRHSISIPNEWSLRDSRKSSIASLSGSSAYPSPHIHPQSQSYGAMDESGSIRKRPTLPAGVQSFTNSPSQISTQGGSGIITSATPTPTLLSPAFNSIHFSPDLSRTQTNSSTGLTSAPSSASWTSINPPSGSVSHPSPSMQPLPSPQLSLPFTHPGTSSLRLPPQYLREGGRSGSKSPATVSDAGSTGTAEATASAALMMLTNEWRGGGRVPVTAGRQGSGERDRDRGKGMSVRDLLSS